MKCVFITGDSGTFTFLIVNIKPSGDISNGIISAKFTFLIVNIKQLSTSVFCQLFFNLHSS